MYICVCVHVGGIYTVGMEVRGCGLSDYSAVESAHTRLIVKADYITQTTDGSKCTMY